MSSVNRESLPENGLIKAKLMARGYDMSHAYGLIVEKGANYALADIRFFEQQVVLPYENPEISKNLELLTRVLLQEKIPFRRCGELKKRD